MLALELLPLARPLPGRLWVQRVEQPRQIGRIILPDGAANYRRITRSSEALVVASRVDLFSVGDRVLLAEIVGREIQFGFRGEVRVLEISPFQILAVLSDDPGRALKLEAEESRGVEGVGIEALLQEPAFEEGSAEGVL